MSDTRSRQPSFLGGRGWPELVPSARPIGARCLVPAQIGDTSHVICEGEFFDAASSALTGSASGAIVLAGSVAAVSLGDAAAPVAFAGTAAGVVLGAVSGAIAFAGVATGEGGAPAEEPAQDDERPAGGYGWQNLANVERQRKTRRWTEDDEEELRTLLQERIAQAEAPDDLARIRALVASYDGVQAEYLTRRGQRAVEYAQRAQTDLAMRLAAREIERFEDDAITALLVLALAA